MPSFSGVSTARNTRINTADLTSGRPADGTYPGMFATVYTTGTQTRAVISRDNPFLVNVDGTFQFSGAASSYDLVFTDAAGATPTPAQASAPPLAWFADGATGAMPVRDEAAPEGASLVAAVASGSTWVSRGVGTSPVWQTDAEYDIRNYGGKGNGSFDNSQSFLDAADDAVAHGGGNILVPPGVWLCDTYTSFRGTVLAFALPSGVSLVGSGPSSIITSSVTPAGIGHGFIGLGTIAGFEYDGNSIPTYAINNAATRETLSVTLTTAANASHFAAGDDVICIGVAGALGLGTRDLNFVVASNASTGKVDLLYPITKNYSTGSPTIANVTAYTARHTEVRDLQIVSAHQTFCGAQIKGLAFRRLVLSGRPGFVFNHFQLNYIRDLRIDHCDIDWTSALASDGVGAGRSSTDIWITNNHIRSNFSGVSLGEGASRCHVTGNCLDVQDAFGEAAIGLGGAYMVDISGDNHIHFTTSFSSVPAIYDANGAVSEKVKIVGNTISTRGTGVAAVKLESPGTKLEGNIIESSTRGVWAVGPKLSIKHNDITLTAGNEFGVLVECSEHSQDLIGNTITNLGSVSGSGIRVLDNGNQTLCNTITLNRITGFTDGVLIINGSHESTIINEKNQIV